MGTQSQDQGADTDIPSPGSNDPSGDRTNEGGEQDSNFDDEGYETGGRLVERPLEQQHPPADPLPRSR
jgi:hypothetical protein